jgi:hypothetical protein
MNLKQLLAVLVSWAMAVAGAAYAQSAVTNEDAQILIQAISSDKEKVQAYCDMVKLERHMDTTAQSAQSQGQDTADEQKHMNELQLKLGLEFGAMMDEYKDINLSSERGPRWETDEIVQATLNTLNKLCGPDINRPQRD